LSGCTARAPDDFLNMHRLGIEEGLAISSEARGQDALQVGELTRGLGISPEIVAKGEVVPTENSVHLVAIELAGLGLISCTDMRASVIGLLATIRSSLRTRAELEIEILALRHQLAVLQQAAPRRLQLTRTDRLLRVLLSRVWRGWRGGIQIVQPATVVSWHRRLFAWRWRWRSTRSRLG
jgi:hypothetical protein